MGCVGGVDSQKSEAMENSLRIFDQKVRISYTLVSPRHI